MIEVVLEKVETFVVVVASKEQSVVAAMKHDLYTFRNSYCYV